MISSIRAINMALAALFLFAGIAMAQGEWATSSGGDIYNTNTGGNIGIGTTSPGAKLDVKGSAVIGAATNTDTAIPLRLGGLAVSTGTRQYGNYGGILFDVNSAYTASARRYLITNALAINKFGIIRSVDAYQDPTIGKAGAITSGTADFVIDYSGNVGVGTTNPGAKLDVVDGRLRVKNRNSEQLRLWDPVTSWAGSLGLQGNDSAGNPTTYAFIQGGVVNPNDGAESGKLDFHIIDNGSSGTKMTILNNGNVGIGKTNPEAKLDVNGNAVIGAATNTDTTIPLRLGGLAVSTGTRQYGNYGGILFDVNSAYTASARRYLITNALAINKFGIIRGVDAYQDPTIGTAGAITSGTADFVIDNNGNVGFGTTSPGAKMDVYGSNGAGNKVDGLVEIRNTGDGGSLIVKSAGTYPHTDRGPFQVYYGDGDIPIITTQNNGNVGIGTTRPQSRLAVKGTITAEEIKVTSNWADFVFEENYKLASLSAVESFIRENKHLPDIPSAKEVKEQGLAVSEILAKHMKKIEELTLYLINMKKENDRLKTTIEIQNEQISEIKALRDRIEALELRN